MHVNVFCIFVVCMNIVASCVLHNWPGCCSASVVKAYMCTLVMHVLCGNSAIADMLQCIHKHMHARAVMIMMREAWRERSSHGGENIVREARTARARMWWDGVRTERADRRTIGENKHDGKDR